MNQRLIIITFFSVAFSFSGLSQKELSLESLSHYSLLKENPIKTLKDSRILLNFEAYGSWDLVLNENKIISDDVKIVGASKQTKIQINSSRIQTYHGYIKNYPHEKVSLSIGDQFLHGQIITNHEIIYFEPAKNYLKNVRPEDVIVYSSKDILPTNTYTCGSENIHKINTSKVDNKNVENNSCLEVSIGLAADFSMVKKYGSFQAVYDQMVAVMNDTELLYDNEFPDQFSFKVGQIAISECATCDPWVDTNISNRLLSSFTIWVNSNFEGMDQSSLWTNRDLNNNASVGLAYISSICSPFSTAVLEDTPTGAIKRILMAHEMGHNFGAEHDDNGSFSIMSPSLVDTDHWSNKSVKNIVDTYSQASCFTSCEENIVAKIDYKVKENCGIFQVEFNNLTTGSNHNIDWHFMGGNPSKASTSTVLVNYSNDGKYPVTLVSYTDDGLRDTVQIDIDVEIFDRPEVDFSFNVNNKEVSFINSTNHGHQYYWDFGNGHSSTFENPQHIYENDGVYQVTLYVQNSCGTTNISKEVVIKTESLTPAVRELIISSNSMCVGQNINLNGHSSSSTVIKWSIEGPIDFESTLSKLDYLFEKLGRYKISLVVKENITQQIVTYENYVDVNSSPTALFDYNANELVLEFVNNSDHSESFLWDFGDGVESRSKNPYHEYKEAGTYFVKLTAINSCGFNIYNKIITVKEKIIEPPINSEFSILSESNGHACSNQNITFEIDNAQEGYEAKWYVNDIYHDTEGKDQLTLNFSEIGQYEINMCYHKGNQTQCVDQSYSIHIKQGVEADFGVQYFGNYIRFTNISKQANNINWNFGNLINVSVNNPIPTIIDGVYESELTAMNDCSTDVLKFIIVSDRDKPNFVFEIDETCENTELKFHPNPVMQNLKWNIVGKYHNISSSNQTIQLHPNENYKIEADYYWKGVRLRYTIPYTIFTKGRALAKINFTKIDDLLEFNSEYSADSYAWTLDRHIISDKKKFTLDSYTLDEGKHFLKLFTENSCGIDSSEISIVVEKPTVNAKNTPAQLKNASSFELHVYPNPVIDNFKVEIHSTNIDNGVIQIFNSNGIKVQERSIRLLKGENQLSMNSQKWPSGSYIMLITTKHFFKTHRLIKI